MAATAAPPTTAAAPPRGDGSADQGDYGDVDKVKALMARCVDDAVNNTARLDRDRSDLLNLLFYRGGVDNQWVEWNTSSNSWERKPYDGEDGIPDWVPRCTTNKFARYIDGISAILDQSDPALSCAPRTDDDEDVASADVAETAIPVLEEEVAWDSLRRELHNLITLTDKAAVVYYYDSDPKYGTEDLPIYQCVHCSQSGEEGAGLFSPQEVDQADGYCPTCEQDSIVEAQDPSTGLAIGLPFPTGKICAKALSSFEFSLPSSARRADARYVPWILTHNQEATEDCLSLWPDAREVILGAHRDDQKAGLQRQYARQMRRLASPRSTSPFGRGGDAQSMGPVVYRLQHDPIHDDQFNFPQGLYAVRIGDEIVESGPLPVVDRHTGCHHKSILIRKYRQVGGSVFSKPPADDLVPIQVQRNLLETLWFMSLMYHAAPMIFIPASVELVDQLTGIPGGTYRYRTHDPMQKPYVQQGIAPPMALIEAIRQLDADGQEVSGLNAVLTGERPKGDPTLGEIQILQERGMAAFRTPLEEYVDFRTQQASLLLMIARESAWSPRFRKAVGENGQWKVDQFAAAELRGAVDISYDTLSAWPKSPLMQQMRLEKAVDLGALVPMQDPEVSGELLTQWGLENFKKSFDNDRAQVAREIDRWKAARDPREIEPPDLAAINPTIHLHLKKEFLKTEEAEAIKGANPYIWVAMLQHVAMLQMAMMPAPAPAEPEKKPGEKGGPPPDGKAVDAAVASGQLTPAGAQPNPLEAAIASGQVQPAGAVAAQQQAMLPSIDDLIAQQMMTPVPPAPNQPPQAGGY